MLVAKEKVEYYGLPKEQPKTIKRRQKAFKLNKRAKIACSFLVFIAFLIGIFFTSRYAQLSAKGVELIERNKQLAALQIETEQLEKEIKKLQSLERIENIAKTKLAMNLPEGEGVYYLTAEASAVDSQQGDKVGAVAKDQKKASADKSEKSETFVGAVSELWGNWVGDLKEAEAKSLNKL